MLRNHTVHLSPLDKFIAPFIEFTERELPGNGMFYFLFGDIKKYPVTLQSNIIHVNNLYAWLRLFWHINLAKQVIFHSLLGKGRLIFTALLNPWILKKSYWIMWGADLYLFQRTKKTWKFKIYFLAHKWVAKNIGHLVSQIPQDYETARQQYGAKGTYIYSFVYPSNLFKSYPLADAPTSKNGFHIMVGNSADPSNNHIEVLEKLTPSDDLHIHCPLSYGKADHAKLVIKFGKQRFGNNFHPITDFVPFNEYLNFLATLDAAVFAHKRQQAFGNAVSLLGFGKKVYFNEEGPLLPYFSNMNLAVGSTQTIDLKPLSKQQQSDNTLIIENEFSTRKLKEQLETLFHA